ncbi:hypothetical protein [Streptomyces sp. bgisy153]|uniref:hypothetical protein n=1 Tax=Streptomyces sp. bgisy153 TaxID=3413793 RepID=UPI003D73BE24
MAETYPLVEQREYGRAERRGGLLRKRTTRDDEELPRLAAHHVRVFRVGEDYVEDHGQLRADDPVVVGASSVTVVDRRVEVPVVVETRIPSAEADDFTLRTSFYCTVTDPCAVVRDGVTDVEALLLAHLREVPGLTEDGADLPIRATAELRARIDARLTAYHEMRPAQVSGMSTRHGVVEVYTPAEMTALMEEMAKNRREQELTRQREELNQQAALDRALREAELELKREEIRTLRAKREEANRHEEELGRSRHRQVEDLDQERGRQELDTVRTGYDRLAGAEQQEYDLARQERQNRFVRAELEEDFRLIGTNPLAADFLAWHKGDITADDLSKRLHEAEERRVTRADERQRLDFDRDMARRAFDRDDVRWQVERDDGRQELERRERREDTSARRQEEARRWDLRHEDERRRRAEERADAERAQAYEREWAKEQLSVRADLGRQAIDRGLFDSARNDPGAFINGVGDVPYRPSGPGPRSAGGSEVPAADAKGAIAEGGASASRAPGVKGALADGGAARTPGAQRASRAAGATHAPAGGNAGHDGDDGDDATDPDIQEADLGQ